MQDTVLSYAELNKWEQRIGKLRDDQAAASKLEQAMAERVTEGVESPLEQTKARLGFPLVETLIKTCGRQSGDGRGASPAPARCSRAAPA